MPRRRRNLLLDVGYIADGVNSFQSVGAPARPSGALFVKVDVPRSTTSVEVNGHVVYTCGGSNCIAQVFSVKPK